MPQSVEDCVKALMRDPKFKPKNPKQTKREAAWAVCQAQHEEQQAQLTHLLELVREVYGREDSTI